MEIFPIEEYQDEPEPTDKDNSILPSFDHAPSKRGQKKQTTKHKKQPKAYITNKQYEEPTGERKARIVPGTTVREHIRKQPCLEKKIAPSVIAT